MLAPTLGSRIDNFHLISNADWKRTLVTVTGMTADTLIRNLTDLFKMPETLEKMAQARSTPPVDKATSLSGNQRAS
jgi:hypothetical protein